MDADDARRKFLEKALTSAGEWTRFADPKALGVLVILGLGVKDLVGRSRAFLLPPDTRGADCGFLSVSGQSCGEVVALASYCLAAVMAALVVLFVTVAVFPRLQLTRSRPSNDDWSLFYFEDIAKQDSAHAYESAVRHKSASELESELARQVHAISVVASRKHRFTKRAYLSVVAFLGLWVVARVASALAA